MTMKPIFQCDEPNLSYETNEFIVQYDDETQTYRYGFDSGCSCYDGFNESNFTTSTSRRDVRKSFAGWVFEWGEGQRHEAAAWAEFNEKVV